MSELDVRVVRATDQDRYSRTDHTVWFDEVGSGTSADHVLGVPEHLRFAAEIDGADPATYPGVYGVRPMILSIPGPYLSARQIPCPGLTWVGVHPDHRRRGVLSAMMRHHFEQVHEQPDASLSALHASEPSIYGRFGYGLASLELQVTLGRGTTLTAPHLDDAAKAVQTQLTTITDEGMATRMRACELLCAENSVGAIVGDDDYFAKIAQELPEDIRDKESARILFARHDGKDVGMALLRRSHRWERGRPGGELQVYRLIGDPAARLALLRRLVDFDLMGSVKLEGIGVEDPLLLWVGGPRGASDIVTYDGLWVRLVDLAEALETRAYSAPCDVVVEVKDEFAPWNQGCWRITVDAAGVAAVTRATGDPDLRLPVEALGAAYLGAGNLVGMCRAGFVEEVTPGAVIGLWRAMRTDLMPGTAAGF